jgi:hypothetical protein
VDSPLTVDPMEGPAQHRRLASALLSLSFSTTTQPGTGTKHHHSSRISQRAILPPGDSQQGPETSVVMAGALHGVDRARGCCHARRHPPQGMVQLQTPSGWAWEALQRAGGFQLQSTIESLGGHVKMKAPRTASLSPRLTTECFQ